MSNGESPELLQFTMEEEGEFAGPQTLHGAERLDDALEEIDEIDAEAAAAWVGNNISYFSYAAGDPPKSRTIPKSEMHEIAAYRNADPNALDMSLKIFDPKEFPSIKEGATIKKDWDLLVSKFAFSKHSIVERLIKKNGHTPEEGETEEANELDKGRYGIRNEDIEEFMELFNEIKNEYMAWGQRLLERYDVIRERDKARLSGYWSLIRHKYPTRDYVESRIRVRVPAFTSANITLNVAEHLPTAMKQAMERQAKAECASNVAALTAKTEDTLLAGLELGIKQLGKRTRVYPNITDSEYNHLREGEVALFEEHEDDKENIPEGFVRVKIQLVQTDENGKRTNKRDQGGNPVTETLMISGEEFDDRLKPRESTDEYCRLFDSMVQDIFDQDDHADKYEEMLSIGKSPIRGLMRRAKDILGEHGESASSITKRLKESDHRRNNVSGALSELKREVAARIVVRTQKKKSHRRKLNV
jgi:hypothetical protein